LDHQIQLIDELDLEPIVFKLVHPEPGEMGMSVEEADELVKKYRCFLKLCAMYPEESIVPSKEIDKVWHVHILDTAKYVADCDAVFGFMLHHFPYFGLRGEADLEMLHAKGTQTRELYQRHFGEDMYGGSLENMDATCTGNCSPSCTPSGCGPKSVEAPNLTSTRPRLERV
jgi:hypothetical protein